MTHVDDLMTVTITLDFNAKAVSDRPVDVGCEAYSVSLPPGDAACLMEELVEAINGDRLFGWMQQESAANAVESGEWVEKTIEELFAVIKGRE